MSKLPKYIIRDVDRYGKVRFYFRKPGQSKVRMTYEPGTAEFDVEYASVAKASEKPTRPPSRRIATAASPSTLRWLCAEYLKSPEFRRLEASTRRVKELVIEHCLEEPVAPGSKELIGDFPLDRITAKVFKVLRDRKAATPEAANHRLKAFRSIWSWAIEAEAHDAITSNVVKDVRPLKSKNPDGFHAWTIDEVEQFERRHPIGTKARLALALFLYTGQRKSDVVQFGRQHVRDGWLIFTQHKNRNRKPNRLEIPIIPALQEILDRSPVGDLSFLVSAWDRPYSIKSFGQTMRKWCDEAGLPQCSSHGLRKAAVARLASLGCTEREIMAITGHRTAKDVDRYARGVRQRELAEAVLEKNNVTPLRRPTIR